MKKFFKNLWCLTNGLRPVDEGTMTLLHRLNPENFTVEEVEQAVGEAEDAEVGPPHPRFEARVVLDERHGRLDDAGGPAVDGAVLLDDAVGVDLLDVGREAGPVEQGVDGGRVVGPGDAVADVDAVVAGGDEAPEVVEEQQGGLPIVLSVARRRQGGPGVHVGRHR